MKVAVFGANSHIAKDLIQNFVDKTDYSLVLFSRYPEEITSWMLEHGCKSDRFISTSYAGLDFREKYDLLINFVGVGDPASAKKMGAKIFDVTAKYDQLALDYILENKNCKYVFLSSGAVYGGSFEQPADFDTESKININSLNASNWYSVAKLYAEARHRSLENLSIIDVRVFNYFSRNIDLNSRFFISDLVNAIRDRKIFETSMDNIVRDFITPDDFFNLIKAITKKQGLLNTALDCYSKSPVDKKTLLQKIEEEYEFSYSYKEVGINATGMKLNYYSINKKAEKLGYFPSHSSISGILFEIDTMLFE